MDFDKLYQEHAKLVWHYFYAKCQDPELANDIVQTTFLKAISQIEGFRGECKLTAWLCQIARNEWLNHCRKMKRQVSLEGYLEMHGEETLRTEDDILNGIIKEQEARQVRKAIGKLEEPYKEVLIMRAYGECSFEEIGDAFGRSATWARVTFYRAKEKLVQMIHVK